MEHRIAGDPGVVDQDVDGPHLRLDLLQSGGASVIGADGSTASWALVIDPRARARRARREQWTQVINTNLNSLFNMCRPVIEGMRQRKFGRIINISSVNAQKGHPICRRGCRSRP